MKMKGKCPKGGPGSRWEHQAGKHDTWEAQDRRKQRRNSGKTELIEGPGY
jgi:hypothetical protein